MLSAAQRVTLLDDLDERVTRLQRTLPTLLSKLARAQLSSSQARTLHALSSHLDALGRSIGAISDGDDLRALMRAMRTVSEASARLVQSRVVSATTRQLQRALAHAEVLEDLRTWSQVSRALGTFKPTASTEQRALTSLIRQAQQLAARAGGESPVSLGDLTSELEAIVVGAQRLQRQRPNASPLGDLDQAIREYAAALGADELQAEVRALARPLDAVSAGREREGLVEALDALERASSATQPIRALQEIDTLLQRVESSAGTLTHTRADPLGRLGGTRSTIAALKSISAKVRALPPVDPDARLRSLLRKAGAIHVDIQALSALAERLQAAPGRLYSGSWDKRASVMPRALRAAHEATATLLDARRLWQTLGGTLLHLGPWIEDLTQPRPVALLGFHGTRDALVLTIQSGERR